MSEMNSVATVTDMRLPELHELRSEVARIRHKYELAIRALGEEMSDLAGAMEMEELDVGTFARRCNAINRRVDKYRKLTVSCTVLEFKLKRVITDIRMGRKTHKFQK